MSRTTRIACKLDERTLKLWEAANGRKLAEVIHLDEKRPNRASGQPCARQKPNQRFADKPSKWIVSGSLTIHPESPDKNSLRSMLSILGSQSLNNSDSELLRP